MGRIWHIDLPWTKPPLSLNSTPTASMGARQGRAAKVKKVRKVGEDGATEAQIPRLALFTAVLHYYPGDNRDRDPMNLYGTVKPLVDGLIDAGVAVDDNRRYFVDTPPVIHDARPGERVGMMWLIVIDLGTAPIEQTEDPT